MCGIVGCIGGISPRPEWVKNSLQDLTARGPDSNNVLSGTNFEFGSTRLAMVDPQPRSNQPFIIDEQVLMFNGEIYNYREIKECELSEESFSTNSDTEVLALLLKLKGAEGIHITNGMFAFASFDGPSRVLLLGRDRLGKKPLYYRSQLDTDGFYFCSLQKPLRELGKNTIDELGIVSYLHLGYILDPLTIYKEIKSIRPYEIVRKSQNEIESSILTYRPKKPKDSSRQIRELVTESITSRVGDHGEVALCLSGGVDSSVIALVLAQEGIKTSAYSVCWKDSDKERYNSDFEQAKKTAKYLGLDFRPVEALRVDEVPDTLDHFLKIMEEPSNNPTGLSMISLYRRISEDGLRLALTGDGADEIFGGYMRYRYISRLGLLSRVFNAKLFSHVDISDWKSWVHWHECFSLEEIDSDFAIHSSTIEKSLSVFDRVFQETISRHSPNNLKKMMALDQSIWLSMESNRRLDRISMEYSIEARSPFQDDNLYEWWLNRGEFGISASLNKRELWRAFPELNELGISKQKKGFISPLGHWIRNNLEWINANLNWLAQQGLITRKSPWEVSQIVNSGNLKSLQKIWTVLVLSRWLQNFSAIENDEL